MSDSISDGIVKQNPTWLITGGAGFIGANFVKHILAHRTDVNVVVLDRLTYAGNLQSLVDELAQPCFEFVKGDINDADLVAKLFAQYDFTTVVNFAAESHVDRSILGPDEFIQTNVQGTLNMLQQSLKAWQDDFSGRLFLQISTDEVYGTLGLDDGPFTERHAFAPNSPYAASKASADHLVRAWHHTYGLPTVTTHCSNNYGPFQFPEKLIPLIIRNIIARKPLPIYGDGQQRRDWLHVSDHCAAIEFVIANGKLGESYCVGGNNECTNLTIVEQICQLMDKKLPSSDGVATDLIAYVKDRPGHDRRYAIDATKLKSLGWTPKQRFDSAIEQTVDWYLANQSWVEAITSGEYQQFYQRQYQHRLGEE